MHSSWWCLDQPSLGSPREHMKKQAKTQHECFEFKRSFMCEWACSNRMMLPMEEGAACRNSHCTRPHKTPKSSRKYTYSTVMLPKRTIPKLGLSGLVGMLLVLANVFFRFSSSSAAPVKALPLPLPHPMPAIAVSRKVLLLRGTLRPPVGSVVALVAKVCGNIPCTTAFPHTAVYCCSHQRYMHHEFERGTPVMKQLLAVHEITPES
jgi:hypothetical protein